MSKLSEIVKDTSHRPWSIPDGAWEYYQEWNNAVFLHWEIPFDLIRKVVPDALELDCLDGKYYVSLVAFTMQNIRPRFLPALSLISDFHEINVRTYVVHQGKQGVYFLNIEAEKALSAFIARTISGLPFQKANIQRTQGRYESASPKKNLRLKIDFMAGELMTEKSVLDRWLTERYCLYIDRNKSLYRYDIHHKEWPIKSVKINELTLNYPLGDIVLTNETLKHQHYSDGIQVVSWQKEKIAG